MEFSFHQQYHWGYFCTEKWRLSFRKNPGRISQGITSSLAEQLDRLTAFIQGSVWQLSTRCSYSSVTLGRITSLTVRMHWAPMSLGALVWRCWCLSVLSNKNGDVDVRWSWWVWQKRSEFGRRSWASLRLFWGQYACAADDERRFNDARQIRDRRWYLWGGGKLSVYSTTLCSKDPTRRVTVFSRTWPRFFILKLGTHSLLAGQGVRSGKILFIFTEWSQGSSIPSLRSPLRDYTYDFWPLWGWHPSHPWVSRMSCSLPWRGTLGVALRCW